MKKELLKGLTEEQIKKVKECKSSEEILSLAKAEGVQLSDEQLEAVSGGGCSDRIYCDYCGSGKTEAIKEVENDGRIYVKYKCKICGKVFHQIKD